MKVKQNGTWKSLGGIDPAQFGKYTLLTPDMIRGTLGSISQRYIGTATHLIIDDSFPTNKIYRLFMGNKTIISLVILTDNFIDLEGLFASSGAQLKDIFINTSNVTNMGGMLVSSQATELDLSSFDTSNVTNMGGMFQNSQATELDLSSFDTSNVTNMDSMFRDSRATKLDLSSFDTSKVTDMSNMFLGSKALELDLSSFDTSNVANVSNMFQNSPATVGYARTQADADKFNASSNKPSRLTFVVKP